MEKTNDALADVLDSRCLLEESAEFRAFVEQMPDTHWAKYDMSAVRLGWEAARLASEAIDYPTAKRAIKLFVSEYIGQSVPELWRAMVDKARKA